MSSSNTINMHNAGIITIGDEILIGQTLDTNSQWLTQQLSNLNFNVKFHLSISDTKEAIILALDKFIDAVDVLIITGGLGPTNDDVTKLVLADYFNDSLVINDTVLKHIQQLLQHKGLGMLPANQLQAALPSQATVLFNRLGTAAGMLFEREGKWIISLPGVPFEMKTVMEEEVLPRFKAHFNNSPIVHEYIVTVGIPESRLAALISDIESSLPKDIKLAYLPSYGMVRLRLTSYTHDTIETKTQLKLYAQLISDRLGNATIDTSADGLAEILNKVAKQNRWTLATAESCTGGNVASVISAVPGAGMIFKGGVVAYDNDVKHEVLGVKTSTLEEYGAVSEATVREMAAHCMRLMNVDMAIAISGILGPKSDESNKPVGLVYMAIASKNDIKVFQHQFNGTRQMNKDRTTAWALIHMIQYIQQKNAVD